MRVEKDLCNEIYKLNAQILSENFVLIIILIIVYIFLPKRHSSLQRAHKKSLLKKAATAEARQVDGIPQASASLGSPAATASTNTTDHATDDVTTWTANVATEATTTQATGTTPLQAHQKMKIFDSCALFHSPVNFLLLKYNLLE